MGGWNLPDNVSDNDPYAPWNQKDHDPRCPQSEDADEPTECRECEEKIEECVCWLYFIPFSWSLGSYYRWVNAGENSGLFAPWYRWIDPRTLIHLVNWKIAERLRGYSWAKGFMGDSTTPKEAECECAEIADDDAASAYDAAEERAMERRHHLDD